MTSPISQTPRKKTFVAVGCGGRLGSFTHRLASRYREDSALLALCDTSLVRMKEHNRQLNALGHPEVPMYLANEFDRMISEQGPEACIIASVDSTHDHYICRCLELGVEAITEKPMTTTAEKCLRVLDAVKKHNGKVRILFNYRFINWMTKIKELLLSGTIGEVKSINLEYLLDTSHGADYFRRWHSRMDQSGGLLVHKSTHHFDLVNWWIDGIPEEVFAYGRLAFYGRQNAMDRGDGQFAAYPRYTGESGAAGDPFALSLTDRDDLRRIYFEAETESGYVRDRNVFREDIDIYDSMHALVRYRDGVILNYSLTAFSPREGMRVTFNGTRGRIELYEFGGSHIIRGQSEEELAAEQNASFGEYKIRVFPHFTPSYEVQPDEPKESGGHYGSDPLLSEQMFSTRPTPETLGRNAGPEQGAASILVGIAANESIRTGLPCRISSLVPLAPQAVRLSELQ
jgi:predicted dehydrogenase